MSSAPIELDFRKPAATRWRWAGWVILVAAAGLAALLSHVYAASEQRHAQAQARLDRLEAGTNAGAPRRAAAAGAASTVAGLRRANLVIDQLTVPWDAVFDAIEAADARGLGVLALTPNARDRTVRLAGESRSMEQLMAYVERVAAQPLFSQVHLLGYSTTQRDGLQVLSFTLAATWRQAP